MMLTANVGFLAIPGVVLSNLNGIDLTSASQASGPRLDELLLAVIGILDAVRLQRSIARWMCMDVPMSECGAVRRDGPA
jgi:hypothetical protein